MKIFTLKDLSVDITSPSGNIIPKFKAYETISVPDGDEEYLLKIGFAVKLVKQD